MATFLRQREVRHVKHHFLDYRIAGENAGFRFDCNDMGVIEEALSPAAQDNLRQCMAGKLDDGRVIEDLGIGWSTTREVIPALIQCGDHTHELTDENGMGDSRCTCGRWYNSAGQGLVDPKHWGEETGETFDEAGFWCHGDYHDYGPEGA